MVLPLSEPVDHGLDLVQLRRRQAAASGKCRHKSRQRAFEGLFHHFVNLGSLHLILAYQRADHRVLIFQNTPLAQPPQHRIGSGGFPAQFLLAKLYQLAAFDGLVLSQNQAETIFAFKPLGDLHPAPPL